jgi:hypothetical protein
MALSLISGLQDNRRDLALVSASHLLGAASDEAQERVSDAAAGYAAALKQLGLKLLAVPLDVIRNIAFQEGQPGCRPLNVH